MPATPKSLERLLAKKLMARRPAMHKTASELATSVLLRCKLAALSDEEYSELANDLQQQVGTRGLSQAQEALPREDLGDVLHAVQKENQKKSLMGIGGVAMGAAAGGASGALLASLLKGPQHAVSGGMLGVIPGTITGYVLGKRHQQKKDLEDLLRERL